MMTTSAGAARSASLDGNWDRLLEINSTLLSTGSLFDRDLGNRSVEQSRYASLLNDLRDDRQVGPPDQVIGDTTLLGLRRAPGSKNRHHNVEGGLVRHMLQMWELWVGMQYILRDHCAGHILLNDRNVWKCILHHDLNKVWKYKLVSEEPWKVDYAGDYDRMTYVLGDTNKSVVLLGKHGIHLTIPFMNALMTAEGGYSAGPRPKTESVLAKLAYLLDDMSANVVDRLQTNRFWDSKEGGLSDI